MCYAVLLIDQDSIAVFVLPAMVHYNQLHNSKETTPYSNRFLLGGHIATDMTRRHYARELAALQAGTTLAVDLL